MWTPRTWSGGLEGTVVAIAPEGLGAGSDLHGLEPVFASTFSGVGRILIVPKGAFAAKATSRLRRRVRPCEDRPS